ncbi:hypothetical protein [uncultured Mailhella sp.]|uniref:hypothetical protein n=1 Tax=uncultured Mailhella sp. TaxID=1981031 RepID=UPI0025DD2EA8|nr:hypothetical protein [uncultured Mailhella sp.]
MISNLFLRHSAAFENLSSAEKRSSTLRPFNNGRKARAVFFLAVSKSRIFPDFQAKTFRCVPGRIFFLQLAPGENRLLPRRLFIPLLHANNGDKKVSD